MPHQYVLLSARMPDLRRIAEAVAASGIPLEHRADRGGLLVVLVEGDEERLTLTPPRSSGSAEEIRRLLPGTGADGAWWTDALVPFGTETAAAAVLGALAQLVDGVVVDLDPET